MERREFLKGTLYTGVMVSGGDGLFNALLTTNDVKKCEVVKMIGIGGCGIEVVNVAIKYGLKNVDFITIDTDEACLKQSNAENKIYVNSYPFCMIDERIFDDPGLAFGVAQKMLSSYTDKLMSFISGAEKIFIVAGLGGETGTFMTPVIAALAHESGALTTTIVTFPFSLEGIRKHNIAQDCLANMGQSSHKKLDIMHDRFVNKNETLLECFARCDQHIVKQIEDSLS